ncbi:MAG: tetratricopeptide repeat protein [Alphaproteobacteria bacterium]
MKTLHTFNLGPYERIVATESPEAQHWFKQGLLWLYGFNMDQAVACFSEAIDHDPALAIAYWGRVIAGGPYYNLPWAFLSETELSKIIRSCHADCQKALTLVETLPVSDLDRSLVCALAKRFPQATTRDDSDYSTWDDKFAAAMSNVHRSFPDDPDVTTIYVLAMMNRTPWALWNLQTGEPAQNADTIKAIQATERALETFNAAQDSPHPGLLHLYIHLLEMSPTPEKAMETSRKLSLYASDCAHFHHMPGHIYVQCGYFDDAVVASKDAIAADKRFLDLTPEISFYLLDQSHHLHLMAFAAMMKGHFADALYAANRIREILTPAKLQGGNTLFRRTMEAYHSIHHHVLIRFGKWEQIVAEPPPADSTLFCVTTTMDHYAKAIAWATLGDQMDAEKHRNLFLEARNRVPADRRFFNNPASSIFNVAEAMMNGEVLYHAGDVETAFNHLITAASKSEEFIYNEPWAWMHPVRHALGALMLEQGRIDEAARYYEEDLGLSDSLMRCIRYPNNIWSMTGYYECLTKLGRMLEAEAIEEKLKDLRSYSDINIGTSCFCRTQNVGDKPFFSTDCC